MSARDLAATVRGKWPLPEAKEALAALEKQAVAAPGATYSDASLRADTDRALKDRSPSALANCLRRTEARAVRFEEALRRIADETHPNTPVNFREAIRVAQEALNASGANAELDA